MGVVFTSMTDEQVMEKIDTLIDAATTFSELADELRINAERRLLFFSEAKFARVKEILKDCPYQAYYNKRTAALHQHIQYREFTLIGITGIYLTEEELAALGAVVEEY